MKLNKIFKWLFLVYNLIYLIFGFLGINCFVNFISLNPVSESPKIMFFNPRVIIIFIVLAILIFLLFKKLINSKNLQLNVKDSLLVVFGLMLFIILIIVYFVNYNTMSFNGIYGSAPIAGIPYYLIYAFIPWIIVNVYTFIKIRENNKNKK